MIYFINMFMIFGLGNPGKKYEKTRHNIGAMTVGGLDSSIKEKVILQKPETFTNLSGRTAKKLLKKRGLKVQNLIAIHDDIDLSLGQIRIIKNRGSAGHKGVESIIKELGTKNFIRFRIGIRPNSKFKIQNIEDFVLKNFTKKEEEIVKEVIKKTATAIEYLLEKGLEKAMTKYNK